MYMQKDCQLGSRMINKLRNLSNNRGVETTRDHWTDYLLTVGFLPLFLSGMSYFSMLFEFFYACDLCICYIYSEIFMASQYSNLFDH